MFSKLISFTYKTKATLRNLFETAKTDHDRVTDLQKHVTRLNASVSGHRAALHDGADVDPSITPLITLPDYTNPQKIILLYSKRNRGKQNGEMRSRV